MLSETTLPSLDQPLDCRPDAGRIQACYLRGVDSLARRYGRDPRRMIEHSGIDPMSFWDSDYHIPCTSVTELLEHCASEFDDSLFGFHLAEYQNPDAFGTVGTLARAAPDFRAGLQSFIDYLPIALSPEVGIGLCSAGRSVALRWWSSHGLDEQTEQTHYHGLLLIFKILDMLAYGEFKPNLVNLSFGIGRRDRERIQERLGCSVIANSGANEIVFPSDILDIRNQQSNHFVYKILNEYLAKVRALGDLSIADRVGNFVRGALASGKCSMELCAIKLGTSSRTLQRNLQTAGTSFSEILERERLEVARRCLHERDIALAELPSLLGYADLSAFGRAFKSWTGMSPDRYREHYCRHPDGWALEAEQWA